ncbi:phage tail tube protein [Aquamicrobium ahrensii]|uniref:Secreted protein n=1 Tax=Aquamicrobium ahrensii TaxID=469551 RepID=A0ABV2KN35_9HYPH
MSDAMIGYSTLFDISQDNGASWITMGEVYDITPPSDTVDQVDVTHMQSPNRRREFIAGLSDPGSAAFEMNFVPGSPSDLKIQEIRGTGEQVLCRITFPNAVTWQFSGQIESYEPAIPTEDKLTASVSFKVSGSTVATPAAAPVNAVPPAVAGLAKVGQVLTAWEGQWSVAATYTYQWKVDGTNKAGATAKTYTPVVGDVGKPVTVEVTATNAAGTATAASQPTADVEAA